MNKQFDYFLQNFQLFYDIENIKIGYGKNRNADIVIIQSAKESFWNSANDISFEKIIKKERKGIKLPFLFDEDATKEIITYENEKAVINYDIVASAFYFLSGWNEKVNSSKDEYGRIKYKDSIINKLEIANLPVVNYYFDILNEAIKNIYNKDIRKNIWGKNDFAASLTHDIDTCKSAWLEGSFSELKKKRFFSVPNLVFKRFFLKDDWFNFETIMDIEENFGAKSSFYFLPQKGKSGKFKNADYDVTKKDIQKIISEIIRKGNEAGVHGSFGTHNNSNNLMKDIERVSSAQVKGNRFHFLMFDAEKSVSVLEDCNLSYDTTLGFAEHIGFRRATCYPFYLWNFEKNNISPVLEIPLTVMDGTLAYTKYMGINKKEALQKVFELISEIKKHGGVFTLLWHNNYFSEYKYTGWKDVYCSILEYCEKEKGLLTSGSEIYNKII